MPLRIGTPRVSFGNNSTTNTSIVFPLSHTAKSQVITYKGGDLSLLTKSSDMKIDLRYCMKTMSEPIDIMAVLETELVRWAKQQVKEAEFEIIQGDEISAARGYFLTKIFQRGKPIHGIDIPTNLVLHESYFTA